MSPGDGWLRRKRGTYLLGRQIYRRWRRRRRFRRQGFRSGVYRRRAPGGGDRAPAGNGEGSQTGIPDRPGGGGVGIGGAARAVNGGDRKDPCLDCDGRNTRGGNSGGGGTGPKCDTGDTTRAASSWGDGAPCGFLVTQGPRLPPSGARSPGLAAVRVHTLVLVQIWPPARALVAASRRSAITEPGLMNDPSGAAPPSSHVPRRGTAIETAADPPRPRLSRVPRA